MVGMSQNSYHLQGSCTPGVPGRAAGWVTVSYIRANGARWRGMKWHVYIHRRYGMAQNDMYAFIALLAGTHAMAYVSESHMPDTSHVPYV